MLKRNDPGVTKNIIMEVFTSSEAVNNSLVLKFYALGVNGLSGFLRQSTKIWLKTASKLGSATQHIFFLLINKVGFMVC